MKVLLTCLTLLFTGVASYGQSFLQLENGTSCGLMVQLYESDPNGGCSFMSATNYYVGPGQSVPVNAPNGGEFVYAEVTQWPNMCFGQALDTDGHPSCVKCPGYGAPTMTTVNTGGCGGCPATITMHWTAYCPSGPGHIHFY